MPEDKRFWELESQIGKLLPSQRAYIFAPERFACIAGGYGSGKTRAGCLKGLILSAIFPGNIGMILCYHGTDMQDRVIPVFFEICPPSWIADYNKQQKVVTLKNGSVVMFRHLHDPNAKGGGKTRRAGANLGWFFIDQMEEIEQEHWSVMISRLRNPKAKKQFGFGAINPNGHDWIYKLFYPQYRAWKDLPVGADGKVPLMQVCHPSHNVIGVAVNSEENRKSNGGFLDDDYFDSLLKQYDHQWRDRYIYCSFDDFTGKIYKPYRASLEDDDYASVHNIEPFDIPRHWDCTVGIDVGGDSPWAIVPVYSDEHGNQIVTPGLVKPTMNTREIAAWIKMNTPWNAPNCLFVIDYENKLAMLELADYGIHARPAVKHIMTGLIRVGTYFSVRKGYPLPKWYYETQPQARINQFAKEGSPRIFCFRNFREWREEHDTYVWNPNRPNEPLKTGTKRFDTCDATRYVLMARPQPSKLDIDLDLLERYREIGSHDPLSAKAWFDLDKRIKMRQDRAAGRFILSEAYRDGDDEVFVKNVGRDQKKYEWEG